MPTTTLRAFRTALLLLLLATGAAAGRQADPPGLLVPVRPDSVEAESEPAPLLIPGHAPQDPLYKSPAQHAAEQFSLGRALELQGNRPAAFVAYRNAVTTDPTIREAFYRMGRILLETGNLVEAMQAFSSEVEQHPDHVDAARELGLTMARLGRHDDAIQQLELLTRRLPRDGANWHALGFALAGAKRTGEAEAALRKSVALPPPDFEEHRDLGTLLASIGREREARAQFRRALDLEPRDPSSWFNLGNLERRAGRPDQAMIHYRRAEKADSSFSAALKGQAELLLERSRRDEAAATYRRWLRRRPAEHAVRLEAIRLHRELGLEDVALELAQDAVKEVANQGESHAIYGMTLAGFGHYGTALEAMRHAERLFGQQPAEQARIRGLIAALRATAPDSARSIFEADSLAHPEAKP